MKHKVVFQGPFSVLNYDRQKIFSEQTTPFPKPFLDAKAVREAVFVDEQQVPISMETEPNDGVSCHWIVYAPPIDVLESGEEADDSIFAPVATLRLVPYPHDPHPEPGWRWEPETPALGEDMIIRDVSLPPRIRDRATSLHDGLEPYVKLGRLSVLPEYRGCGFAGLLVRTALKWLRENPRYFESSGEGTLEDDEALPFKGLVCVHAQKEVEGAWRKWGFTRDEKMGTWFEAGIPHVGMFQRLDI